MSGRAKLLIGLLVLAAVFSSAAAVGYAVLYQRSLQPLEEISLEKPIPLPPPEMEVFFGFLPFWQLKNGYIPKELTHVAYFSLPVEGDGEWRKKDGTAPNPGWRTFQSDRFHDLRIQTLANNQKLILTLSMLEDATITQFLDSQTAQATLIRNTRELLSTYSVDGINLDVEYASPASALQRRQFNAFVKEFSKELSRFDPKPELSIDVYATASKPTQLWDIVTLAPLVDHIVIMGYDFHQRSSPVAGPVAPLYGKSAGRWDADIMTSLKDLTLSAPPEKLILGIPLYGYEWKTSDPQLGSPTFPRTGRTATLKQVRELLVKPDVSLHWDWDAVSPYLTYSHEGETKVVSFEDESSLQYKLHIARQAGFAGVAFWALGFADENDPVWNLLPSPKPTVQPSSSVL